MSLSPAARQSLAEITIGLSVCCAAFYFGLEPLERSLADTRAKVAKAQSSAQAQPSSAAVDPAKLASTVATIKEQAQQLKSNGMGAREQGALFGAYNALAAKFGVRIDQLAEAPKPVQAPVPSPAPAPTPGPPGQPGPEVAGGAPAPARESRVTYTLSARADYTGMTAFVAALPEQLGFVRILSIKVQPAGTNDPREIIATIQTEHFDFDISEIMALIDPSAKTAVAASPTPPTGGQP